MRLASFLVKPALPPQPRRPEATSQQKLPSKLPSNRWQEEKVSLMV